MSSSETDKPVETPKPEAAVESSSPEGATAPSEGDHTSSDAPDTSALEEDSPSATTEETDSTEEQKKPWQGKPRKLYQALARVEGVLKVKADDLVLVTKGDKAELEVVQIAGAYTAVRLLKRPANRRQGVYSLYPLVQGFKVVNYMTEPEDAPGPAVPPNNQMFISGKLTSRETEAFYVDIGRNKRTRKAKKQVEIPIRVEGQAAEPKWNIGQWIGLVLHREGTKWIWKGETKEVLRGAMPYRNRAGKLSGT